MDPLTIMAGATTAYNAVKKAIHYGKEFEDVTASMGKWYTRIASAKEAQQKAANPPFWRKIVYKQSVEKEALDAIIIKKQIQEQEKGLKELIMYTYGKDTLEEMFQLRKDIAKGRAADEAARQKTIKSIKEVFLLGALLAFCGWIFWESVSLILAQE
tara:strand:+ start:1853 stop:2323 length:471 start_codon:yes stop_codon:yes gene_type:complete